jgi:hypothetical protein
MEPKVEYTTERLQKTELENLPTLISVTEAAKTLHVSPEVIRSGLIVGSLPFGAAIPSGEYWHKGKQVIPRYKFVIPRKRFEKWVSGDDLVNRIPLTDNIIKFEDGRVFILSTCMQASGYDNETIKRIVSGK